jgi:NAD(P)-dependent dehydrogenase (short-subunit alcohol dehydrogenase family)
MADRPILLVTGGSRGIGAAICTLAAARGFDVAVNYRQDAKAAASVVDAAKKAGGKAVAIQGDMANEDDVTRVFEAVDKSLGRLTHLVYNSGVAGKISRVEAMETKMLREVFDVNVIGAFLAARAAIPRISTKHGGKGGAIVLISSVAASLGSPNTYVWYAASKGAIDTMTKGLALELAEDNIRVNAVSPGLIETEMNPPERIAQISPMIPMKRTGTVEEIAEAVVFLLSEQASYITSANLRVSGGR